MDNTADIPAGSPANDSNSENVDFGDVDDDGDWDAVFADGGDSALDQNRIWINQGGLQAGTKGVFVDDTAARFPAINDQSRDIEFVDIDGDADLDLFSVNTSTLTPASNRWWVNTGEHSGVYVDETSTRWIGLGSAGPSVPAADVLPGGGFPDFSCDCDFGDLDNDGDMDLFQSSYGGAHNGQIPSRVFLNDGAGYFEEFNPSGYQLTTSQIADGEPGLWCEGTQQADTLNTNGTNCDIASSAIDIDLGDIDGDFDLDVLHGARQELPRMFENRLAENGGVLGFRDITGRFPAGYASGSGHYEQELGDLDGDGDLDIHGLDWHASPGFADVVLQNDGNGSFGNLLLLPGFQADGNEVDFLDHDLDGFLDVFISNFTGPNLLYRNNAGSGLVPEGASVLPTDSAIGLDADACDVDGDGDYDLFLASDAGAPNLYWENTIRDGGVGPTDVSAPYIPNVEQAPDRVAGAAPTVIRAQVYDNAAYYITWYNETWMEVSVGAGSIMIVPMVSSGGQIFRGEIGGGFVGTVHYRIFSEDEYGNRGSSAAMSYDATGLGVSLCLGDGSDGTDCPCTNNSAPGAGEGCLNSQGHGAILLATGSTSLAADDLVLSVSQARSGQPVMFLQGAAQIRIPFKDGKLCTGHPTERLGVRFTDGLGAVSSDFSVSLEGHIPAAGVTRVYQAWYRDPGVSLCGQGSNFTSGLELVWLP